VSVQTYVGSVQLRTTLVGRVPSIHLVSVDVPPDCEPGQFEANGTFQPAALRLRKVKLPPASESLSYQNVHRVPFAILPLGGIRQVPGANKLLSTVGTELLLPKPQLAVASVVTGDVLLKPSTGAKCSDCMLVYRAVTRPYCEG
jgi:hypothetical protein